MLKNVFGRDDIPVTATWYQTDVITPPATTPPVVYTATYPSFLALSIEEGNSRVYGGIHFRFELNASIEACTNVANYIFEHKMQQDGFGRLQLIRRLRRIQPRPRERRASAAAAFSASANGSISSLVPRTRRARWPGIAAPCERPAGSGSSARPGRTTVQSPPPSLTSRPE